MVCVPCIVIALVVTLTLTAAAASPPDQISTQTSHVLKILEEQLHRQLQRDKAKFMGGEEPTRGIQRNRPANARRKKRSRVNSTRNQRKPPPQAKPAVTLKLLKPTGMAVI